MKRIIINADDFGYRKEINKGIIEAHKNGVVKSTTLLTNRDAFKDAVALAKENPDLKVGLHIDLDKFFEILKPEGVVGKLNNPNKKKISAAIDKQIDKFLKTKLKLTHFDSHHHAHLHPEILPLVAIKAKELNVPIRFFTQFYNDLNTANEMKDILDSLGIKYCPHFLAGWQWGNVDEPFELAELMTHPGYNEEWREYDLAQCCNPELIEYLSKNNIQIISFDEI